MKQHKDHSARNFLLYAILSLICIALSVVSKKGFNIRLMSLGLILAGVAGFYFWAMTKKTDKEKRSDTEELTEDDEIEALLEAELKDLENEDRSH